jgi:hypothetical protein
LLKEDEKFLESLDQVALKQLDPEVLGLKNISLTKAMEMTAENSQPQNQSDQNSEQTDKNDAPE